MLQVILSKSWKQHPNICVAIYFLSQNPSKWDEQDMWDTAGEARMNS